MAVRVRLLVRARAINISHRLPCANVRSYPAAWWFLFGLVSLTMSSDNLEWRMVGPKISAPEPGMQDAGELLGAR